MWACFQVPSSVLLVRVSVCSTLLFLLLRHRFQYSQHDLEVSDPYKCWDFGPVPPCPAIPEDLKSKVLSQEDREEPESLTSLLIVNMSTAGGSLELIGQLF